MDKIFVKNLLVRGVIGVNDWERDIVQDILVNITVFTDTRRVAETDKLEDSVSYKTLAKKTQAYIESKARYTVEALANDLANICLEENGVQKVIVRVEKPGAVRFAESVGVEIERSRDE
ncbi:MAG TPA: dihydroneopterin aldolase [Anaerolineales bacterium]|nr:dihydroneopterin aldolase [Anaerolineales bacterium]